MSVEALIGEVRRRRTPDEELYLTAIAVLADSDLVRFGDDQIALALAGWEAVRAEGATEIFPTVSPPTLRLVRSGVALTEPIFRMLPEDDKANLVCIGFLGIVGKDIDGDASSSTPDSPSQPARPGSRNGRNRQPKKGTTGAAKPRRRSPAKG